VLPLPRPGDIAWIGVKVFDNDGQFNVEIEARPINSAITTKRWVPFVNPTRWLRSAWDYKVNGQRRFGFIKTKDAYARYDALRKNSWPTTGNTENADGCRRCSAMQTIQYGQGTIRYENQFACLHWSETGVLFSLVLDDGWKPIKILLSDARHHKGWIGLDNRLGSDFTPNPRPRKRIA
jgi:hypothetical protein